MRRATRAFHLVRVVNNRNGKTTDVLQKTPSLLKAAHNAPFGADGRFATVQGAAKAAILSPVELRGQSVTPDPLDPLAAFVLSLPDWPGGVPEERSDLLYEHEGARLSAADRCTTDHRRVPR